LQSSPKLQFLKLRNFFLFEIFGVQTFYKQEKSMKRVSNTLIVAAVAALQIAPTLADTYSSVQVRSHPSQGDVVPVEGATARLATGANGIHVSLTTSGLVPGNVYTLLMPVMNLPSECPALPCTPKDVLKRSDIVLSDVAYAGGAIADVNGNVSFDHYQPVGKFQTAFFDNGLMKTDDIEIHLVVNDHGPLIEDRAF
jgi:hypothetical protein